MPHCKKSVKNMLDTSWHPLNGAELNYCITALLRDYTQRHGDVSYQNISDCLGALEGAKAEFVRLVVTPFEDGAIERNGSAYDPTL